MLSTSFFAQTKKATDFWKNGIDSFQKEDYINALGEFDKAIELKPNFVKAISNRALTKYELKDYYGAIIDLNKAFELDPNDELSFNPIMYFVRGLSKSNLKDSKGACEDWRKASDLGFKQATDLLTTYCNSQISKTKITNKLPQIGDKRAGGIVFYIAPESTDLDGDGDLDTGLVCSLEDQSDGIGWFNRFYIKIGTIESAVGTGASNTAKIVSELGEGHYAASAASSYRGGGFEDWFLPSQNELSLMYKNLHKNGYGSFSDSFYWSSTIYNDNDWYELAWTRDFVEGYQYHLDGLSTTKTNEHEVKVRAVRAF